MLLTWYSTFCLPSLHDLEKANPDKYTMNIDVLKYVVKKGLSNSAL